MTDSRRAGAAALLVLPAALVAYFAFNSGGFYPGPTAYAAIVLCVVALVRAVAAVDPFEGMSWWLVASAGCLALFGLLALLSKFWSHAPATALTEYDLPLVYLLVFVICGSLRHSAARIAWAMRLLAVALIAVCACGLITRVLPHVWPTSPELANNRLSFPVTYWNVLGFIAVVGIILCVHFSSAPREPRPVRVIAAAGVPILASTLYFTFSRGAIAIGTLALVVYLIVGRPRNVLSTVIAVLPTTAIAVSAAYNANLLATPNPTTRAAVAQGHHVAAVIGVCVLAAAIMRFGLLWLDGRLEKIELTEAARTRAGRIGWISLAAVALIALIALNGVLRHDINSFIHNNGGGSVTDLRARLTDPGNNGRINMWRIAWHGFQAKPLLGNGAGSYANSYAKARPLGDSDVHDAHSLYLETLDELGVVGFALLATAILLVLVRVAMRARGPSRPLYAALFAVLLAWAVHAGIDWDWEMPVATVVFFGLGGIGLATEREPRPRTSLRSLTRVQLGLGCVLLAVAPVYVWLSQQPLDRASKAFAAGNCRAASKEAMSSISVLGIRPEAYEILGFCDIRQGLPRLAIAQVQRAISLDPHNWKYTYSLALMRAAAGLNPLPQARAALAMDPHETFTIGAWNAFKGGNPASWEATGRDFTYQFTSL